ncbi:hypothetical protein D9M68_362800 [compost metagenome]
MVGVGAGKPGRRQRHLRAAGRRVPQFEGIVAGPADATDIIGLAVFEPADWQILGVDQRMDVVGSLRLVGRERDDRLIEGLGERRFSNAVDDRQDQRAAADAGNGVGTAVGTGAADEQSTSSKTEIGPVLAIGTDDPVAGPIADELNLFGDHVIAFQLDRRRIDDVDTVGLAIRQPPDRRSGRSRFRFDVVDDVLALAEPMVQRVAVVVKEANVVLRAVVNR